MEGHSINAPKINLTKNQVLNHSFSNSRNESIHEKNKKVQTGRWSQEEHKKFIEGIIIHGTEWKKIKNIVKTRTSSQARSHAQKFFLKIKKLMRDLENDNKNILKDKILNIILTKSQKDSFTNAQKEKLLDAIFLNIKTNIEEKVINNKSKISQSEIVNPKITISYNPNIPKIILEDKNKNENKKKKIFSCIKKRKPNKLFSESKEKIFIIQKDLPYKSSYNLSTRLSSNGTNIPNNDIEPQNKKSIEISSRNNVKFNIINNINNNNDIIDNTVYGNFFFNFSNNDFINWTHNTNYINNKNNFGNEKDFNNDLNFIEFNSENIQNGSYYISDQQITEKGDFIPLRGDVI